MVSAQGTQILQRHSTIVSSIKRRIDVPNRTTPRERKHRGCMAADEVARTFLRRSLPTGKNTENRIP